MRRCPEICKYCEFLYKQKDKLKQARYMCDNSFEDTQLIDEYGEENGWSGNEFTAWKKFFERDVPEGCLYYVEHCMKEYNK